MNRTLLLLAPLFVIASACGDSGSDGSGGDGGSGAGGPSSSSSSSKASGSTSQSSSSSSGTTSSSSTSSATSSSSTGVGGGDGGGGGGLACAHDVCTEGVALDPTCNDSCVALVCADDDYCCDMMEGAWDDICVGLAAEICGAPCPVLVGYGDLIITEIMNNPNEVADAVGEWFEVYNNTAADIDMDGFTIEHDDMDPPHIVVGSLVVPAGGYAVIGVNGDAMVNGGVTVDYVATDIFHNNTADLLAIYNGMGDLIDETAYDQASGLDPDGPSRSLDPAFLDADANDDDTNFCEASSFISGGAGDTGTPGAANDPCP